MKKICIVLQLLLCSVAFGQNFDEKEVTFWDLNKTFKLSGTLTTPKNLKKYPVAILISGSGQTDRDETIGKHKIFKTLAEYLSNNGTAVLRYDDRGGYKSGGPKVSKSTTQDLALDVEAAYYFLKKEEKLKNIGLIGHSEGGGIGPLVAEKVKGVAFFVSMAGPAVDGKKLMIKQNKAIFAQMGIKTEHIDHYISDFFEPLISNIVSDNDSTTKANEINRLGIAFRDKYPNENITLKINTSDKNIPAFMAQMNSSWFRGFLRFNPIESWKNVNCPTLAINGSLDVQVDAIDNIQAIEALKKSNIKTKILENHNHLFQRAKIGSLIEYHSIKEDISEEALLEISSFIKTLKR
jgi:uncharacterized protein